MLKKLMKFLKRQKNKKAIDVLGEGVDLSGTIEKRTPGAKIEIGDNCRINGYVVTETSSSKFKMGKNSLIGPDSIVDCVSSINIEDDVLISYQVIIADSDNHSLSYQKRKDDIQRWKTGTHNWADVISSPIVVKKGAWIGARSIILKGVTIGEGAVIGMGSVVTSNVEPYTVVAGNPARKIKDLGP
ncbi:MAG: acyltransferase [Oligoflexia bacterium]|nr:acyltransferase [Oligoflexia bacterium]